jgi:WD40 repeat protein
MRTWLVLAAVVAVGAAAIGDTLRGSVSADTAPAKSPPATAVRRIVPPGVPSGFMGSVYFSDLRDDCRLHVLRLAGFTDASPPEYRGCGFSLSPDGKTAAPAGSAWSPLGGVVAVPGADEFTLESTSGHKVRVEGKSPAFKPDGTLTYLRDGKLVEWTIRCSAGDRLFTVPGDNATARCIHVVYPHPLRSVAWLAPPRFAAVTRNGSIILADGTHLLIHAKLPAHRRATVAVSPQRRFVTIWLDGHLAGTLDAWGGPVVLPPLENIRALAWSPTERWAMLATDRGSVYLFRPGTGDARLRRLDIRAGDVAWR